MPIQDAVNGLLVGLRLKKEDGPQLTREQAMSARPVRNPSLEWELNENDEAVVHLPRRKDFIGRLLAWMFFVPESRPVVLDEVGTFVWESCDGNLSVTDLVASMADRYTIGRREVEISLTEYLKTLGKRGMVGMLIDRAIAAQIGLKGRELVGLDDVGTSEEDLRRAEKASGDAAKAPEAEAEAGAEAEPGPGGQDG